MLWAKSYFNEIFEWNKFKEYIREMEEGGYGGLKFSFCSALNFIHQVLKRGGLKSEFHNPHAYKELQTALHRYPFIVITVFDCIFRGP